MRLIWWCFIIYVIARLFFKTEQRRSNPQVLYNKTVRKNESVLLKRLVRLRPRNDHFIFKRFSQRLYRSS
jgi:hypothetical protein